MKKEAEIAHEIGKQAFSLIGAVNGLIMKAAGNAELMKISEGLHEVEWKAERLAERLEKIPLPNVQDLTTPTAPKP